MARKALLEKSKREPKFRVRAVNRCVLCGRPRGFMRKFGLCRVCFRDLASKGHLPGVRKASF
ncbi:MAG: type Z 30S ribosomal protein S14 [Candidatus Dadabacteria bacterium]|nr:type Z 30S ribosomal protein S14 [Candidatus Dadabacteria bacterium]MYB26333.1 type Z 30S ribosomal protein S14 [Candidatus Dadabacteria bacterium]MYI73438.1 type Z 30S ribosomal protein S14 [Candidatus Dadabacteria bacterium]